MSGRLLFRGRAIAGHPVAPGVPSTPQPAPPAGFANAALSGDGALSTTGTSARPQVAVALTGDGTLTASTSAATATVLRAATFETALSDQTSGYSNTNDGSSGGSSARVLGGAAAAGAFGPVPAAYKGAYVARHRHPGYTGGGSNTAIVRGNWFSPASATVETDPVIARGTTRWTGCAVYVRSQDSHDFTGFMRWSDFTDGTGTNHSLFEVTLEDGTLRVDLKDYGGQTSTGVANRTNIHSRVLPRTDGWTYVELGAHVTEDNTLGWSEFWVDGVQVGSRVTGRTLKLASHNYRRVQWGLGSYGLPTSGYVNPNVELFVDDCYVADGRRGP